MAYLYETHLHTNVGSKCGRTSPEDYIHAYVQKGYSGVVVTDHFFNGNCAINSQLPWKMRVDAYAEAYERAKEEGDKQGLDVFFGMETRLGNDECLIYGVDKQWLYEHPEFENVNHKEQYDLIHSAGGAIVQAHPFRERSYMDAVDIYPKYVDALEGYNKENARSEDLRTLELAERIGMIVTAGSDVHDVAWMKDTPPFGVVVDKKWASIKDYVKLLRSHNRNAFEVSVPEEEKRRQEFSLNFPVHIHWD